MASEVHPKPINVRLLLHRIAMAASRGESDRAAEQDIIALDQQTNALRARVAELEKVLAEIRDRDWVENCLDPQWAPKRAARALKSDEATS